MKYRLLLFLIFFINNTFSQDIAEKTASFFGNGKEVNINSPWTIGLDYDLGFAGLFSFNIGFTGGINSQVNRVSTFGDVFFGEFTIGPRIYLNKLDRWDGVFITAVARVGIYNIPFRTEGSQLIISRATVFQYGMGIYFGYRWKRNLVKDIKNFPFSLMIEPYLGWTLDYFTYSGTQKASNINRFTIGIMLKLGFYTYKKSKKTLEAEAKEQANATNQTKNIENDNNLKDTNITNE